MRIESKVVGVVAPDSREPKPTVPAAAAPSSKQPVSTIVTLSQVAQATTDDTEVDPANRTRIQQIRDAIKHDNYPIDLDKLASKIFEDDKLRGHS